jgi:hypothetical protein
MLSFFLRLLFKMPALQRFALSHLAERFAEHYQQKSALIDAQTLEARKTTIKKLFLEKWLPGQPVIIEGTYNWLFLSDGKSLPKIDLLFSEVPLGVLILGPESASWEEARLSGLSKEAWERAQADIKLLERYASDPNRPFPLMVIKWEQSASEESLLDRFSRLSNLQNESPLL